MAEPRDCPRWERCSAPLCPLDPQWRVRKMVPSEPVCLYLRELAKPDGSATLARFLPQCMVQQVIAAAPGMLATASPLRRALRGAASTPSRLGQFLDRVVSPRRGA
jgi:hypothetical protein